MVHHVACPFVCAVAAVTNAIVHSAGRNHLDYSTSRSVSSLESAIEIAVITSICPWFVAAVFGTVAIIVVDEDEGYLHAAGEASEHMVFVRLVLLQVHQPGSSHHSGLVEDVRDVNQG